MRYLIFAGEAYCAAGGARDYIMGTYNLPAASHFAAKLIGKTGVLDEENDDTVELEWSHVLDTETKSIILEFGKRPYDRSSDVDMITDIK
jgi:hypothetical protein